MDLEARSRAALAQAIRTARENAGLTQTQLGDRAGVDQAKVSRYERGVNEPPLGSLLAFDQACAQPRGTILRLASLLDHPADAEAAIRSDPTLGTDDAKALLRFYQLATAARPDEGRAAAGHNERMQAVTEQISPKPRRRPRQAGKAS